MQTKWFIIGLVIGLIAGILIMNYVGLERHFVTVNGVNLDNIPADRYSFESDDNITVYNRGEWYLNAPPLP